MAERILKKGGRKLAPRKKSSKDFGVVLAGTYKDKQLGWSKKNNIYNYPVRDALLAVFWLWHGVCCRICAMKNDESRIQELQALVEEGVKIRWGTPNAKIEVSQATRDGFSTKNFDEPIFTS